MAYENLLPAGGDQELMCIVTGVLYGVKSCLALQKWSSHFNGINEEHSTKIQILVSIRIFY